MTRWALLTGAKGEGKTSRCLELADRLRRSGIAAGGFVQVAVHDEDGRRTGYDLVHLTSGERVRLARSGTVASEGQETFCSHTFDLRGFARARAWLEDDAPHARVLLVDEVSKLEAAGRGHAEAVRYALGLEGVVVVLSVRAEAQFSVLERFFGDALDPVAALEVSAPPEALGEFVAALERATRGTP